MNKVIVVDIEQCVGCKSCELACAVAHSESKDVLRVVFESPRPEARLTVRKVADYPFPNLCRHCRNAPCIEACPTHALARTELGEPVLCELKKCVGSAHCVSACPYGVLKLSREGKVLVKCDFCLERVAEGEEPACVQGCPTEALRYVSVEELSPEATSPALEGSLVYYELTYQIDQEKCTACGICRRKCPVEAISGEKKVPHSIDQDLCIRCGVCYEVCKFDSVELRTVRCKEESPLLA
jgi:carbon-monoxide dehydrogenase iron sulfur subunit